MSVSMEYVEQGTHSRLRSPTDFQLLFESAPGQYLVLTVDLAIAAVSDSYLRATMTQRENILGRNIFDVFPDNPEDVNATGVSNLRDSLERVVRNRVSDAMAVQKYDIQRPISQGGGFEERYWSPVNTPVLGPEGEIAYIIHRVDDVTEFVRLTQQRIEQHTIAQTLFTRGEQMEAEIVLRGQELQEANRRLRETNEALTDLHICLESRVQQRTAELAQANDSLQMEIAERRKNEVLLNSILNHTFDAIITISDRGIVETFNGAAERIFGYSHSEVMGKNVKMLMSDPYHSEHDGYIVNYLRTGRAKIIGNGREVVGRRKDGSQFPIELTVTEFRLAGGEQPHFIGVIRDITRRKQAEEHQARLVEVLEATPDFVGLANADLHPLFVNQAGRTMIGLAPEADVTRTHIRDYVPEWSARLIEQEGIPSAISHGTWAGETALLAEDGREIPVSQVIVAHKTAEGEVRFLSTIMRDLSERRKLEERLHQSQKLEAFGQLAGGVAHDFNNLLTVIIGYCEYLSDDADLSGQNQEMVQEIRKAGDRATTLTRQLLAFSRRQVLQPKVLNLNEIIAETSKMLERLIGEDIEMTTLLCSTLWPVKVDAGQAQQVLMNLAVNARDAMPEGGKLTIETSNVELEETYCDSNPDVKPGDYVAISVSDTGCGMDEKTKARIFEPFFTTKAPGKGTGLGLATVFGVVKQSGGHVTVYSEPDNGTVFRIYLPKVADAADAPSSLKLKAGPVRGTETVLVVEDADLLRDLACRILRSHGYQVLQARNGCEALTICEQQNGRIHLVLTDLVMPEMSGRQLAEHLRNSRPDIKVLLMSGYTDDSVVRRGILEADTDFIQKPFSPPALCSKVREILDK